MQAHDIMTRHVVTVPPDLPVLSLANLLVERRISGVPVLEHDRVIGMVTEQDLCRRAELGTERRRSRWAELFSSNVRLASDFVHAHGHTVRQIMTTPPVCVQPDTPLADIAGLFETRGIKRVPVLDGNGKLVGLVSRSNLVQAIAAHRTVGVEQADQDARVRDNVLRIFAHHRWGLRAESNVIVADGVVHLWGMVGSDEEQTALQVAAEEVRGVRRVDNHTIVATDSSVLGPWSEMNHPADKPVPSLPLI